MYSVLLLPEITWAVCTCSLAPSPPLPPSSLSLSPLFTAPPSLPPQLPVRCRPRARRRALRWPGSARRSAGPQPQQKSRPGAEPSSPCTRWPRPAPQGRRAASSHSPCSAVAGRAQPGGAPRRCGTGRGCWPTRRGAAYCSAWGAGSLGGRGRGARGRRRRRRPSDGANLTPRPLFSGKSGPFRCGAL